MRRVRYIAVTKTGEPKSGTFKETDVVSTLEVLHAKGWFPITVEETGFGASTVSDWLRDSSLFTQRLSARHLIAFTQRLSIMLAAGHDLNRSLRFANDVSREKSVKKVTNDLRSCLLEGKTLAAAMSENKTSFPPIYIGLVRAGEVSGTLALTMESLSNLLETRRKLRAEILGDLAYPFILVVGTFISLFVLLTTVVPEFTEMFANQDASLPPYSLFVFSCAEALTLTLPYMLAGTFLFVLAGKLALQLSSFRCVWDRFLLNTPLLGAVLREKLGAEFTRPLSVLLERSIPLPSALHISGDAIQNAAGKIAVREIADRCRLGEKLSECLSDYSIFPLITLYMISLGEESAQLASMAKRSAEIHEDQLKAYLKILRITLAPLITIIAGAFVAALVAALMIAMFSLNDLVG